jgi:hypothetical protein
MSKLRLNSRASRLRNPKLIVNSFEVRCMPIEDLYCPVRDVPIFAEEVAKSIVRVGLANPVIIVRGPRDDLVAQIKERGGSGDNLPDTPVVNCVFGGTNRITAARRLNYTHIDCVLMPDFTLGGLLQDLQRASYNATKATSVGTG